MWNGITDRVKGEPVMTMWLLQSLVSLVVLFGVDLTPEQTGGIIIFTAALLSWYARSKVSPVSGS